jgi:isocitrate dehydrogenase
MNEFDDYYEPEMGQAIFGQPYRQFKISNELEYALAAIETRLMLRMGQIDKHYESPFRNTGSKFACDTFEVESYSWDDEVDQPWNFKWRDIEVSWYKYFGRGMSVNKNVSDKEIEEMLDECHKAIDQYELRIK